MQDSTLDNGPHFDTIPSMLGFTSFPSDPTNNLFGFNPTFGFPNTGSTSNQNPNINYDSSQAMIRTQSAAVPVAAASQAMTSTYSQQPQKSHPSNRPSRLMIRGSSSPASTMPFASSTGRLPTRLSPAVAHFPQDSSIPVPSVGQAPSDYIADHAWLQMPAMPNEYPISPACPSLINYDTDDELPSPMTRQHSAVTEMQFGVQMSRDTSIAQQFGAQLPLRSPKHIDFQQQMSLGYNPCVPVPSPLSAEFKLEDSLNQHHLLPMTPVTMRSVTMERSESASSNSSATSHRSRQSLNNRNKDALARTIETATRLALLPKPSSTAIPTVTTMPPKRKLVVSPEPGTKKKTRPAKRQKKEKIMCDAKGCGKMFSGSHELQRHRNNTHQTSKRFIIRQPVPDTTDESKTPIFYPKKSVADCEKCKKMTTYACDYNAASHLRRKHFNPKESNHGREDEERGGKSGGNWPSMQELKKWIEIKYYDDEADDVESDMEAKASSLKVEANHSVPPTEVSAGSTPYNNSDESFNVSDFVFEDTVGLQGGLFANSTTAANAAFDPLIISEFSDQTNPALGGTLSSLTPFSSEVTVTPQPVFNIDFTAIQDAYN